MGVHVVVDGSNLATEGRTLPSLRQLDEAVRAYMEEFPGDSVTVVVDATFGHRIDPSEVPAFDEAVENNELVSPPAGAIGRGDAFVLQIANKAGARILSNDSFQEFHGSYDWLFDEGRLMGGKPVPHVGWVFVLRAPVRGPASRRAVRDSRKRTSPAPLPAMAPLPSVPATPPPGRAVRRDRGGRTPARPEPVQELVALAEAAAEPAPVAAPAAATSAGGPRSDTGGRRGKGPAMLNEALPFLEFIPQHPVGSVVQGTVESFSSHGAYIRVGELSCYVPLRYLATPAPRAAREVLRIGEDHDFVVVAFDATRRGIDIALPGFAPAGLAQAGAPAAAAAPSLDAGEGGSTRRRGRRRGAPEGAATPITATAEPEPPLELEAPADEAAAPRRRRTGRAAGVAPASTPASAPAVDAAPIDAPAPAPAARRGRRAPTAAPEPAPAEVAAAPVAPAPAKRARKAAAPAPVVAAPPIVEAAPGKAPARKAAARKAAAPVATPAPVVEAPAPVKATGRTRKAATTPAPTPAPAVPAKKTAAKKASPAKAAPAKATATKATTAAPAKKAAAGKAPAKQAATTAKAPAAKKASPRKAAGTSPS